MLDSPQGPAARPAPPVPPPRFPVSAARRLPPDETHVWVFALDSGCNPTAQELGVLHQYERNRAARFATAPLRAAFVRRRGALRSIVASYSDLSLLTLERVPCPVCGGQHGRPHLVGGSTVGVSTSSGGALGACVLARSSLVGIDVEPLARAVDLADLGLGFLNVGERRWVAELGTPSVPTRLLQLWTVKEAYLKACGTGLVTDPAEVDACALVRQGSAVLRVVQDHVVALVVEDLTTRVVWRTWPGATRLPVTGEV